MTTRTDRNQAWDTDGNLVEDEVIEVDITAETNRSTIEQQTRTAMANNRTFIAAAKPSTAAAQASAAYDASVRHARQLNGLIRLLLNELNATD